MKLHTALFLDKEHYMKKQLLDYYKSPPFVGQGTLFDNNHWINRHFQGSANNHQNQTEVPYRLLLESNDGAGGDIPSQRDPFLAVDFVMTSEDHIR